MRDGPAAAEAVRPLRDSQGQGVEAAVAGNCRSGALTVLFGGLFVCVCERRQKKKKIEVTVHMEDRQMDRHTYIKFSIRECISVDE